jgi:hypothetical protein
LSFRWLCLCARHYRWSEDQQYLEEAANQGL